MSIDRASFDTVRRWRHEYKYMIDGRQEAILRVKAECVLSRDPHTRPDGLYLVRSLYFDDFDDTCLWENLSGCDPRSKFRIRYYNDEFDRLFLEKKIKRQGMCLKESCTLTREECAFYIRGASPPIGDDMPPQKQRLLAEIQSRGLRPKSIVTYTRRPYVYGGGNVRVTIDSGISSSDEIGNFLSKPCAQRPVLPCGQHILEVKWGEVLPRHIKETILPEGAKWIAFSKYTMCRKHHL